MSQNKHLSPGSSIVHIPDHPDLSVVCHNVERYPTLLLERLAHDVSQLLRRPPIKVPVTGAEMKDWLRQLHMPLRHCAHPLAAPWQHLPIQQRWSACATWLRQLIQRLEFAEDGAQSRTCGRILRLRFLDRRRCKTIMLELNISERHYHRLQNAGLEWLVEQYRLLQVAGIPGGD
ncbi:MAG: hypothetical protein H0T53_02340 [Herpetosiphonaceae bacterium]|nr:hypothetical protein [Herpetosiphonaceae bacterium]